MKHNILSLTLLLAAMLLSSCIFAPIPEIETYSYDPWVDLSNHFDLDEVEEYDDGIDDAPSNVMMFNSLDLTRGRDIFSSTRIDDREYNATVVGTKVYLRSEPKVHYSTARALVNTGDKLTVMRSIGLMNGHYWSYVYVNTGNSQGVEGYICSDYIVEQKQYEMITNYVITPSSNITIKTPSKELRAIADVLLKLEADKRHPRLSVQRGAHFEDDIYTIETYTIRNLDSDNNNSLVVAVKFFNNNNDYLVLGVVPGCVVNSVEPKSDGSYDVYFK